MAQICRKRLNFIRNGFTMLEMALECDKRLKYLGNDVYMWEIS